MQYAPTEFVTSVSVFTSLALGLYATFTCVETYGYGAKQHCSQLSQNSRVDCDASAQRFKTAEAVLLQTHHILIRIRGRYFVIWKNITAAFHFNGFSQRSSFYCQ